MDKKITHFKTSDNLSLEVQKYIQNDSPEKIILIVHGHGEHAGRFQKVAEYFSDKGISVFALTLRGHGNSEGKKGHAPGMEQLLTDIEYFIRFVRVDYLNADLYLYGHSMGGNIVLNYLAKDQSKEIKGGIVTSPWLKLAFEPPKCKVNLGNFVADIKPDLIQSTGLKAEDISSLEDEVAAYKNDALIHSKISAKLFSSITKGGEFLTQNPHEIKHRVLLAHGQLDKIISHDATAAFAKNNDLFRFKSYPKSKHEIHHDLDYEILMNDIMEWVMKE
jgi:alpha-beta hydrolase superfamily lysophospholipase